MNIEPSIDIYHSFTNEQKLVFAEAALNPMLALFLSKLKLYYREQRLELNPGSFTPVQFYQFHQQYLDIDTFITFLIDVIKQSNSEYRDLLLVQPINQEI